MRTDRHTPYVCFEGMAYMVVEARSFETVEIPVVIRNLDGFDCPGSTFQLGPGWHPPNGRPFVPASLPVKGTAIRDRVTNQAFTSLKLGPGEERLAKYCIRLGEILEPGCITPVITIRRYGEPGGKPTVNFFEWEGAVLFGGGMTHGEAAMFLYPTGPLR